MISLLLRIQLRAASYARQDSYATRETLMNNAIYNTVLAGLHIEM